MSWTPCETGTGVSMILHCWPPCVCFETKFKGKPDAGKPHVRFDEGRSGGAMPPSAYSTASGAPGEALGILLIERNQPWELLVHHVAAEPRVRATEHEKRSGPVGRRRTGRKGLDPDRERVGPSASELDSASLRKVDVANLSEKAKPATCGQATSISPRRASRGGWSGHARKDVKGTWDIRIGP